MDNEEKTEILNKQQQAIYNELTKRGITFKGYSDDGYESIPQFHQKPVERSKYKPHKGLKELKKLEKRQSCR